MSQAKKIIIICAAGFSLFIVLPFLYHFPDNRHNATAKAVLNQAAQALPQLTANGMTKTDYSMRNGSNSKFTFQLEPVQLLYTRDIEVKVPITNEDKSNHALEIYAKFLAAGLNGGSLTHDVDNQHIQFTLNSNDERCDEQKCNFIIAIDQTANYYGYSADLSYRP